MNTLGDIIIVTMIVLHNVFIVTMNAPQLNVNASQNTFVVNSDAFITTTKIHVLHS